MDKDYINKLIKMRLLIECMFSLQEINYWWLSGEYIFDEQVEDCKFRLYIFLLTDDKNKEDMKNKYKDFADSYRKLTSEQKERIKKEVTTIFKEKENQEKEKEKKL